MAFEYLYRFQSNQDISWEEMRWDTTPVVIHLNDEFIANKKKYLLSLSKSAGFCFEMGIGWIKNRSVAELTRDITSVINFLFLPNYLKKADGTIFLVNQTDFNGDEKKQIITTLRAVLKKQGVENIIFETIESTFTTIHNEKNGFIYTDNAIFNLLSHNSAEGDTCNSVFARLLGNNIFSRRILITIPDADSFAGTQFTLSEFEAWVAANEPNYAERLNQINALLKKEERLVSENRKLKFKVSNYEDYLKITRDATAWHVGEYHRIVHLSQNALTPAQVNSAGPDILFKLGDLQNQVTYLESNRQTIIDWYNKEYEVLPLWYKRFGHIIKVLMGKRTFKSLFQ